MILNNFDFCLVKYTNTFINVLVYFNIYNSKNWKLPWSSSEFFSLLFNSSGTGICISNNDGILFLSVFELKLLSMLGFGSSSNLFW